MKMSMLAGWMLAMLACAFTPVHAGQNIIGRQSQNEGLVAVPGKATIDGDLADWDWSGRISVFADTAVRSRYSTEVATMWDRDNLYLAVKWKDPTPMYSTVDPEVNPGDGWKSDAVQLRIKTDQTLWITTWYYTPKKIPVLQLAVWKDPTDERKGTTETLLRAAAGKSDLGQGVEMAYKADADGKGYVQEIKIPWKLLYKQVPEIQAGLKFRMGMEFLWGDPTGRVWPVHRYADNMQPGETSREFFWSARNAWGDVELVATGNVPVRQYVEDGGRIEGTIPIRMEIPKKAARLTLVVEDSAGRRVRNLAADISPDLYTVGESADKRTIEVKWDGLDDHDKIVPAGAYRVRGLTQNGLSAEYDLSFYNPGTPPWATQDGTGAWGGDHSAPSSAAAAGDFVILGWGIAEGGSGIVGIGPDGLKKWGEKRGALMLAADAQSVYVLSEGWAGHEVTLFRLGRADDSYQRFLRHGQPRPFEIPLAELTGSTAAKPRAIMAGKSTLAVALSTGKIVVLDKVSAEPLQTFDAPGVTALAYADTGELYAVLAGKLCLLDAATGQSTVIATPGLDQAGAITTDHQGNILILDVGADSQVKAYSPAGKLVYTAGKKGGRPIRGPFDPDAMTHMSSVAVDAKGQIWVTE
ncbi:MAG: sugar-binding protein, partial [Phycisphaerae bacterium]